MLDVSLSTRQVFDHELIEHMSKEERQFAKQQLRSIFSTEMSKVSVKLNHKRQVSSKLLEIEKQQEEQLKNTYDRLSLRMSRVDSKRQEQIKKRIDTCKTHDDEWKTKVDAMEKRQKKENRDAEIRARKFRQDHEDYIKKKQQIVSTLNQKRQSTRKSSLDNQSYRSSLVEPIRNAQNYRSIKVELTPRTNVPSGRFSSLSKLDESIKTHKQRSSRIQFHKQQNILQKALVKLDTINQRRKRLISMHQTIQSNRTDRNTERRQLHSSTDLQTRTPDKRVHSISVLPSPSVKKTIRPEILIDHITVKNKRELEEFKERGKLLQKSSERNKKQMILRQIRQKVTEYKILAQRPT